MKITEINEQSYYVPAYKDPKYPRWLFTDEFKQKAQKIIESLRLTRISTGSPMYKVLYELFKNRANNEIPAPGNELQFYKRFNIGRPDRLNEFDNPTLQKAITPVTGTTPQEKEEPEKEKWYFAMNFPTTGCNTFPVRYVVPSGWETVGSPGYGGSYYPIKYIEEKRIYANIDWVLSEIKGRIQRDIADGLL